LASTIVFRSKPLPNGASAALPSRAANTRPDWTRSAGFLIWLAKVLRIFAALHHSTDSRKFLSCAPKKIFTIKKSKNKAKYYIV
jgi:hypothetical protein